MIGETLGSYRIVDKLGEGGMGVVWLAEHPLIGRRAAVKLLLPEVSRDPEVVTRFFNEARASALIRHPGIVDIFDFGVHANGSAYIVMELLEGESLRARLRRGPLPEATALRIARQCAAALAAAHAKGIVHRDLKPDNLYLVPDAEVAGGERVKILDFGIAKLSDQAGEGGVKTRTGSVMGSPAYMSPEQCKGAGAVDERADVYSLGCVLFEMACGRPPFVAAGVGEMLAMHIYEPAPAARSVAPGVSPAVEALLARTLAKRPDERPRSMDDLARALEQVTSGGVATPADAAPTPGADVMDPPPGTLQTTLGGAAAQVTELPSRRRGRAGLLVGGVAVAVAAAVTGVLAFGPGGQGGGKRAPVPSPAPAPILPPDAAPAARAPSPPAAPDAGAPDAGAAAPKRGPKPPRVRHDTKPPPPPDEKKPPPPEVGPGGIIRED